MRCGLMLGCLVLWAGVADAQVVRTIDAVPADRQVLAVHVGGRAIVHSMPGGGAAYEHQWPGVYFESRFEGSTVYLAFSDTWNEYRLLIDDLAPVTIAQPGEARLEVSDLPPGTHSLRLEKVTESIDHAAAFDGFYIAADEKALPVNARARQIEFIGDSSMSGYGDRSTTRQCTPEEVRLRTDTQNAFPALSAKHFNADYQINAISGRGLVRNYAGVAPDYVMSKVYPYADLDKRVVYTDPAWQPQIVVVKLNADFATPLNPGEAWATPKALQADYWTGMTAFVKSLHVRYPSAAILAFTADPAGLTPQQSETVKASQDKMADMAHRMGIAQVGFVPLHKPQEGSACDYHGSLADHRVWASDLTAYIEAHPGLWQGK